MAKDQRGGIARVVFGLFRFIRNYFILIGILVTALWVAGIVVMVKGAKMEVEPVTVHLDAGQPAQLWLDLAGKVTEHEPDFSDAIFAHFFGNNREIYLPDLRQTLRRAAKDNRISELTITMMPMLSSPAEYADLRRILTDFKESSSKPVHVYINDIDDWSYYVATAGSQITMSPAGEIAIPGPTFQLVYFGEALKKLGIEIDVVRAGKYKSAFEPFILNKPTEPTVEEYTSMQQSLLDHMVSLVAKSRHKDEAKVREWYKRSLYTSDEAVQNGIVDNLGYAPELPTSEDKTDKPEKGTSKPKATLISIADYNAATTKDKPLQESVTDQGGIGLIEATGEINMVAKGGMNSDDGITPEEMRKRVHWALESDDVKAVVLRVSSPGGSATASDVIWNELKTLAAAKPLVVSMGAYAASGGYYISAPARRIIAEPTTVTGSIGVIGMLPSARGFEDKWGVSFYVVTGSDRRDMLNLGAHASAADKALLDSTIAHTYQTFLQKVAEGRKLPLDKVAALAQGRVYTGLQAKELGLVDEIGGMQAAFNAAKQLAGFDVNKLYPVLHYEDEGFNISDCLRRPAKFKQCLKHLRSQGTQPTVPFGGPLAPAAVGDVAATVQSWISQPDQPRALVLWSGYLGGGWR